MPLRLQEHYVQGNGKAGTLMTKFYYTFSVATGTDDATIEDETVFDDLSNRRYCHNNHMKKFWELSKQSLNGNIFRGTSRTSYCYNNTFERNCYKNTFGHNCYNNTLQISCSSNIFEENCFSIILGEGGFENIFKQNCRGIILGYNCTGNTFERDCYHNTFGACCNYNKIGEYTSYVTAGSYVKNCSFGDNPTGAVRRAGYIERITIDAGTAYATIHGGTSSSDLVKNAHVLGGYYGGVISFELNKDYSQMAGVNSSGAIKVWKPADLIS